MTDRPTTKPSLPVVLLGHGGVVRLDGASGTVGRQRDLLDLSGPEPLVALVEADRGTRDVSEGNGVASFADLVELAAPPLPVGKNPPGNNGARRGFGIRVESAPQANDSDGDGSPALPTPVQLARRLAEELTASAPGGVALVPGRWMSDRWMSGARTTPSPGTALTEALGEGGWRVLAVEDLVLGDLAGDSLERLDHLEASPRRLLVTDSLWMRWSEARAEEAPPGSGGGRSWCLGNGSSAAAALDLAEATIDVVLAQLAEERARGWRREVAPGAAWWARLVLARQIRQALRREEERLEIDLASERPFRFPPGTWKPSYAPLTGGRVILDLPPAGGMAWWTRLADEGFAARGGDGDRRRLDRATPTLVVGEATTRQELEMFAGFHLTGASIEALEPADLLGMLAAAARERATPEAAGGDEARDDEARLDEARLDEARLDEARLDDEPPPRPRDRRRFEAFDPERPPWLSPSPEDIAENRHRDRLEVGRALAPKVTLCVVEGTGDEPPSEGKRLRSTRVDERLRFEPVEDLPARAVVRWDLDFRGGSR